MFPAIEINSGLTRAGSFGEIRSTPTKFIREAKRNTTNISNSLEANQFERTKYTKNKTQVFVTESEDVGGLKHSKTHAGPLMIDIEQDPMEEFKNEPWYRKDMKSFRSEKNNRIRTVVYTLEPKKKPAYEQALQLLKDTSKDKQIITPNVKQKTSSSKNLDAEPQDKKQKLTSFPFLNNVSKDEETAYPVSLRYIQTDDDSNEGRGSSKELLTNRDALDSTDGKGAAQQTRKLRTKKRFLTMTNPDNPTFRREVRKRNFEVKTFMKANMFEGLPYVQYEGHILKDHYMQKVILRDMLKVLQDKCNSLKIQLVDKGRIQGIFPYISSTNQIDFNKMLEEIIALIHHICSILLQEFKEDVRKLGMAVSPLDNPELRETEFYYERDILKSNIKIYKEIFEFMKDSFDCYLIMSRQKERKGLDEHEFTLLLKCINKCRFNVGTMVEALRNHDKNITDRLQRLREFKNLNSEKNNSSNLSPIISAMLEPTEKEDLKTQRMNQLRNQRTERVVNMSMESETQNDHEFVKKIQRLNKHLQKKFKLGVKSNITRESKVVLNQDRTEYEKALLLADEASIRHEISKKADNRVKVKLEKLKNPLLTPEIATALSIARKLHLINGKEFVNFSETKEEE